MKRFCSIILMMILFLLPLGSCTANPDSGGGEPGAGQPEENSGKNKESISVLLPYFSFTNEYAGLKKKFDIAAAILSETYGVEVQQYVVPGYDTIPEDEIMRDSSLFFERLSAEVMAGNGPDVFLNTFYTGFPDLEKKIMSGAFLDLNEFIENDPDFDISEYDEGILGEGVFDGKRHFIPLSYNVPMMITYKERLASNGFTSEDFSTYERFISAWEEIQSKDSLRISDFWEYPLMYCGWLSECLDFESGTVDFSLPSFERGLNLCRAERVLDESAGERRDALASDEDRLFYINDLYFTGWINPPLFDMKFEDIEILPIPNAYGNNTAQIESYCMISSAAKNPENAWFFLKIMLGDEVQRITPFSSSVPVKSAHIDEAIDIHVTPFREHYGDALIERIKEIYRICDNAVLQNQSSLRNLTAEYIYSGPSEQLDFETFKEEMDDYFRIYLSE